MIINKVEICGVNTSKLPLLTSEEKKELFMKIKSGDEEARQTFINSNLRLVLSIIQKFSNRGEQVDDLFQVGCIGLIKAIDNFDLSQDVQFSTYAVPMIIGEIRRYLRDNNAIRVSRSLRDIAYKAVSAREKFATENSREPSVTELAKLIDVSREDLVIALEAIQETVSMYEPIFQEGGDTLCIKDQIKDEDNTELSWSQTITIKEAIKKLTEREQLIINLRFFDGYTQVEVADEIGISQAQVSRLEKNALKHLKKHVN